MNQSCTTTVVAATEPEPAQDEDWSWIADQAGLQRFAENAKLAGVFAIDTEFVRRRTYHAELGLIQLATAGQVYLLDPLEVDGRHILGALLADAGVRKLIHAGGEDIEVLSRWSGQSPANLIDTQIASQLAGVPGQIGYQRLVAERLDVQLSKGEQQSDWLRRPLSERQCSYAAADVRYLQTLADQLLAEVDKLKRRAWLEEECQRQIERVLSAPPEYPHLLERNAGQYSARVQWRLCALLRWRDIEAQERDKPRNWILDSGVAIGLAHCDRHDIDALTGVLKEAGRRDPQRAAEKMAAILDEAGAEAPADFPIAPPPLDSLQKKAVQELREALIELTTPLGLAPEFIATRATLEQRARSGEWPSGLGEWRLRLLQGL